MYRYFHVVTVLAVTVLFGNVQGAEEKTAPDGSGYIQWQADNFAISEPLGGLTGDSAAGRKLVVDRKKGNCIACHMLPIQEAEFPGNLGPPLLGVASRLSEGEIRLRVVDIKQLNPRSIMPGYYRNPDHFSNVKKKYRGKTVLSTQEVENIVAWLVSLK